MKPSQHTRQHAALLIAGTHSGCGKTTVTLGIMAALAQKGVRVQPFKCGPDFIDPSLHHMVTGRISCNLDIRMCGEEWVRQSFVRHTEEPGCAVVEGVMGLFDGGDGSAARLAATLGLPVILVIDCRSAAESVAAVAHGFATLDSQIKVAGIICNRIGSDKHKTLVRDALETHCSVPLIGFLPRQEAISIPSRHLGLHMGDEQPLDEAAIQGLGQFVAQHLDLEGLIQIAHSYQPQPLPLPTQPTRSGLSAPSIPSMQSTVPTLTHIAVAYDAAFCFYYQDNLDLLRQSGAELFFFSPLQDQSLPSDVQGLYLGGGYPELYAARLSKNIRLREQIRAFAKANKPIYAECGGFMYLCEAITDQAGMTWPMVGLYPCRTRMQDRLRSLGYRQPVVEHDCVLGPKGTQLYGHEFHYSTIETDAPTMATAFRLVDGRTEGYLTSHKNVLAGYIHLHWGRTPELAQHFVQQCRQITTDQ